MPLPDAVKKWSIIVPTQPLPPRTRVAIRRRLLARLELGKAERAKLVIIGHPKSGNTWLRTMLSRLYQVRHGLPASVVVKSDELNRLNPQAPRFTATNGCYSYEGIVGEHLAAGGPDTPLKHKPVMLLARHPCDIAVSWYFQFTKRQSAHKQELINHFIANPIDRRNIEMWDFVRHSDIGLPFLIDFLNTWQRNLEGLERSAIVRYEDLRAEPGKTLKRITELMGEDFSEAEIEEAVSFGSFDNLRKLETQGFFKQGGLARRDTKDPESFKVRRGKVGGFRDYFSEAQADELMALVQDRLSPVFDYTDLAAAAPQRAEASS